MSNIGFMENTVKHIEQRFQHYVKNKKSYPTAIEKADYRNFIFHMERIYRYGEMEDEVKYKKLLKTAKQCDLTQVVAIRKEVSNAK